MRTRILTVCALYLLSCTSCSSNELSRSRAEQLISGDKFGTAKYNQLHWVSMGYSTWIAEGGLNNSTFAKLVSTANQSSVTLSTPVGLHIDEITGITDTPLSQGIKEVLFRWSMPDVPDSLKPTVVWSGTGTSTARRYDDGWRIEAISSVVDDTAIHVLTASQQSQIEQFKTAELNRQEQIRKAYDDTLAASKTPTKELFKGKLKAVLGAYGHYIFDVGEYVVTDVNITFAYSAQPARKLTDSFVTDNYPEQTAHKEALWFACVDSFQEGAQQPDSKFGKVLANLRWANQLGCGAPNGFAFNTSSVEERDKAIPEMNKALNEWKRRYALLKP